MCVRVATEAARQAGGAAIESASSLESVFFNDLVLVLKTSFVHGQRGMEDKDGNPLNEVRVLSSF